LWQGTIAAGYGDRQVRLYEASTGTLHVQINAHARAVCVLDPGPDIDWIVPEAHRQNCSKKGKKEDECHNFVQILAIANASHLLTCGTFAFDPKCGVIDVSSFQEVERLESGRGKCPFEPAQRSAAVMAGGVLYTATVKNYLGTQSIISRAVGRAEDWIRTETLPSWLNAVALSPAEWGDEDGDDEIYFFFTEISRAFDSYEHFKVPRVARVCAGDLGGRKTLQQKWTTFLKADLLCPGPEHGQAASVLQDMAILRPVHGGGTPIFYGIFSSQWEGAAMSAVCAFRPQDIRTVLNGSFRELRHDCNRGLPVMDNDVPQPRPGECITNNMKLQQFSSSLFLPDRVLTFIRDHPLMDKPVFPADGRSLLVTTDTAYLRLVAHRVPSLSGKEYDVLYLGTGDGHLHRAVQIGAQLSVLEDLALFPEPQPVDSMKLYQNWLLIGSRTEVTQVNTTDCGRLQSCSECILAQDPVCAWSFRLDACVAHAGERGGLSLGILRVAPAQRSDCAHPPAGWARASLTLLLIGRRQQRQRQRELLARDKVGLDLGAPPSGTTSYSQDPPSPSPEDERLPLALAKRGSGFGGFPPPFLLDPCPSPAHIRLTGAPLAACDETSI
ncbi:semaphorin-4F, partial [Camelus ferus]